MSFKRVFLIVLDSVGIGELPDAAEYSDEGSNTLRSCYLKGNLVMPVCKSLGLFNIDGIDYALAAENPLGAFGRFAEASKGKDTTIGHWEISGIISEKPLPTYPDGFPDELIEKITECTGRGVVCNKPYSGTAVIEDFGKEHIETGKLIIYTSADSVLQVAAHEDVVPLDELYDCCKKIRGLLKGEHSVGRVIARPFKGEYGSFYRTSGRHDYSLEPYGKTVVDLISEKGLDTISVGKISDIFAGRGFSEAYPTASNSHGMKIAEELLNKDFKGLCFVNLVDFDMVFGHRNNVDGYVSALNEFDNWLGGFIGKMKEDDVIFITSDHGCDPSTESTDHSREYTFMLSYGRNIRTANLGTRNSFADIGKTVAEIFKIKTGIAGNSFLKEITGENYGR